MSKNSSIDTQQTHPLPIENVSFPQEKDRQTYLRIWNECKELQQATSLINSSFPYLVKRAKKDRNVGFDLIHKGINIVNTVANNIRLQLNEFSTPPGPQSIFIDSTTNSNTFRCPSPGLSPSQRPLPASITDHCGQCLSPLDMIFDCYPLSSAPSSPSLSPEQLVLESDPLSGTEDSLYTIPNDFHELETNEALSPFLPSLPDSSPRESPFSAFSPVPLQPLLSDPSPSKDFHPPIESVKSFFEEPPAFTAPSSLPSMLSPPLTPVLFQHPPVHPSTPLSPPPAAQPLHQEGPPLESAGRTKESLPATGQQPQQLTPQQGPIKTERPSPLYQSPNNIRTSLVFPKKESNPPYYNGESASHSSVPKRPLFPYLLRNVPGRQLASYPYHSFKFRESYPIKWCHQCKARKRNVLDCRNNRKQRQSGMPKCVRSYCDKCLLKHYNLKIDELRKLKDGWLCPGCTDTCSCAACIRKRYKDPRDIPQKFQEKRNSRFFSTNKRLILELKQQNTSPKAT